MAKQASTPPSGLTRKQLSRAAREARIQRVVLIGTGVVVGAVILLLVYAVLSTQIIQPRRLAKQRALVVATIGDDQITVGEMQDRTLFQYFLFLAQSGGQQPLPPSLFAQPTLDRIIEDRILQARAEQLGVVVTDADIQEQRELMLSQLLGLPFNAFQLIPTRTPTATFEGPTSTPTVTSTFVYTLTPTLTPTINPTITPTLTPTPTDEDAPTATPTQTNTPGPTSAPLTAEDYDFYLSQILPQVELLTGLSEEAFRKAWDDEAYSNALREKVMDALQIEVDDKKTMVHAAHILVATEEEAQAALERIENGEDFESVAAELSTDGSAPRGGDLGWFGRGEMIAEFEDVAFSVPEGEISQPVESQFGWHIIKVYEKAEVPATDADKDAQRREKFLELLQTWREESGATVFEDVLQENLPELPS